MSNLHRVLISTRNVESISFYHFLYEDWKDFVSHNSHFFGPLVSLEDLNRSSSDYVSTLSRVYKAK